MHSTNQTKIADLPIAANKILVNSHTDHKLLSFPQTWAIDIRYSHPCKKGEEKEDKVVLQGRIVCRESFYSEKDNFSNPFGKQYKSRKSILHFQEKQKEKPKTMFA